MRPITPIVPGHNLPLTMFAKDQPEYLTLPTFHCENGRVVTRWKLTFGERVRIMLSGNLWLSVLTFNRPLQPVKIETQCPITAAGLLIARIPASSSVESTEDSAITKRSSNEQHNGD